MTDKLDRFTRHARQVLQIAQEEAIRLNHNYVGTEHLLLGLVKEENGLASRVLREAGHDVPQQKRILELNAGHPVVKKLADIADEARFADWAALLYDQALLAEGSLPSDPAAFSRRVADLMAGS